MTKEEAISTLCANVMVACERAKFDSATCNLVEEALDMAIEALEKQIPIAPETDDYGDAICPKCGEEVVEWMGYCENCGSAISWRDWL